MEGARLEFRAKCLFHLLAGGEQIDVAVEVRCGLSGGPEHVAFGLLRSHGFRDNDVVHENATGVGEGEFAHMQFGIDIGPGGAE